MRIRGWLSAACILLASFQGNYEIIDDQCTLKVLSPSMQGIQKAKVRLEGGLEPDPIEVTWPSLAAAFCRERRCKALLIEGEIFASELSTNEVFQIAQEAVRHLLGLKVAFIQDASPSGQFHFFRLVATNRGMATQTFTDLESALIWLGFPVS